MQDDIHLCIHSLHVQQVPGNLEGPDDVMLEKKQNNKFQQSWCLKETDKYSSEENRCFEVIKLIMYNYKEKLWNKEKLIYEQSKWET